MSKLRDYFALEDRVPRTGRPRMPSQVVGLLIYYAILPPKHVFYPFVYLQVPCHHDCTPGVEQWRPERFPPVATLATLKTTLLTALLITLQSITGPFRFFPISASQHSRIPCPSVVLLLLSDFTAEPHQSAQRSSSETPSLSPSLK